MYLKYLLVCLFIFSANLHAGLMFKKNHFNFEVTAGKKWKIGLRVLLKELGDHHVWSLQTSPPDFVTLDQDSETLFIEAGIDDEKTWHFDIQVQEKDSDEGARAKISLVVHAIPTWKETSIDFGKHKEDRLFKIDLNDYVTNPLGINDFVFKANKLPSWMSFDPLSG